MVRSLPKKRHIVVVQRENVFESDETRNRAYLLIAKRCDENYRQSLKTIFVNSCVTGFGPTDDALYAFYEPTELTLEFENIVGYFSRGGRRIQRIRYYSRNL